METFAPFSAQAWSYAGQMTLLGMGMIFAVLALLLLVLMTFKLIFGSEANKKKKKPTESPAVKPAEASVPPDDTVAERSASIDNTDAGDSPETVAVIMAAIAAYMAEQGVSEEGFRVVSFRRENNGRAWNNK